MFDWSEESKEHYFQIEEDRIREAGYEDFLVVDRTGIGLRQGKLIKVYIKPFKAYRNWARFMRAKKAIEGLNGAKTSRNKLAPNRNVKTDVVFSYILIEMEQ